MRRNRTLWFLQLTIDVTLYEYDPHCETLTLAHVGPTRLADSRYDRSELAHDVLFSPYWHVRSSSAHTCYHQRANKNSSTDSTCSNLALRVLQPRCTAQSLAPRRRRKIELQGAVEGQRDRGSCFSFSFLRSHLVWRKNVDVGSVQVMVQ